MFKPLDANKDGEITKVELAAFIVNIFGPYALIITGLFAPVSETLKTALVSGGLAGSGLTKHTECRRNNNYAADVSSYLYSQMKESPPFDDGETFSEF